jgi:hypothetical protein
MPIIHGLTPIIAIAHSVIVPAPATRAGMSPGPADTSVRATLAEGEREQ